MSAKTVDECVREIFDTHINEGNDGAWRTKKTRFANGTLSHRAKMMLLEEFGYSMVTEAQYEKK